jgi:hypothetical protein
MTAKRILIMHRVFRCTREKMYMNKNKVVKLE